MSQRRLLLVPLILMLVAVAPIQLTTAQTNLLPNEPRSFETLWGGFMGPYYNDYRADLTAGHWAVIVTIVIGLEVNVTVSSDSGFINVIAVSGHGSGNYPNVDFTLSGSGTVYIRVAENSVYHDTFGSYNIGIYDDLHNPVYRTITLILLAVAVIVIIVVVAVVTVVLVRRRKREFA